MKIPSISVILTCFLCVLFSGCVSPKSNSNGGKAVANSGKTEAARTNIEELSLLVKVPYESEDVVWKEDPIKRRVVAVLRFSPTDSDRIAAEAEQFGPKSNVPIAAESWFPSELIAQSEMSGDGRLNGVAYPANNFYMEPYTNGRITRIEETDYFVLELTAK